MAYVPVPKDMNAVKTKVAFNLTKRQIVCFGAGLLVGLPAFFLIKGHVSSSTATLLMVLVMLPFSCLPCMRKTDSRWKRLSAISCRSALSARRSGHTKPTTSILP